MARRLKKGIIISLVEIQIRIVLLFKVPQQVLVSLRERDPRHGHILQYGQPLVTVASLLMIPLPMVI